jgi:hypothetical protein
MSRRPVPIATPRGRPPKHGARALSRYLANGALDGRTWVARALRDIRLELAADAGGIDCLTARERVMLDRCAAATLICQTIEAHVFDRAPVNADGELLPILRKGYVSHVQSLSRMLQALGLRPSRPDQTLSLNEYLALRSAAGPQAAAAAPGATDADGEEP